MCLTSFKLSHSTWLESLEAFARSPRSQIIPIEPLPTVWLTPSEVSFGLICSSGAVRAAPHLRSGQKLIFLRPFRPIFASLVAAAQSACWLDSAFLFHRVSPLLNTHLISPKVIL